MGRKRSQQMLIDELTRLVIAYNNAVLLNYDAPSVQLTIKGGDTFVYVSGEHTYLYGGPKPPEGKGLKDGIAHVKALLHKYREEEKANAGKA